MPTFFRKRPIKPIDKQSSGVEPRKFLDLNEYEGGLELSSGGPMVRIGEIYRYEEVKNFSEFVYNGDILILDYTPISEDELTLRRVISELKNVVKDVDGDVVSLGKNYLFVTPNGIKIDRNKIRVK
ncbi:MAG: cell division protein SepF [Thermoplasmata archaeon]